VVSRVVARFLAMTGALVAALALALSAAPAAQAKPKPQPAPTALQIVARGLPGNKVIIQQKTQANLFSMMLSEVSWLANATPQTSAPRTRTLGPRYTVTLLVRNEPQAVYELYPLATGGARAHRPAKQPTGKKTDGWFFGHPTMSEALRHSGAPLKPTNDVVSGGIGGGYGEDVPFDQIDPIAGMNEIVDQMRRLFLLNGAVLVVILFGLGGISYLIRRRV
jgi:hypothetical protein